MMFKIFPGASGKVKSCCKYDIYFWNKKSILRKNGDFNSKLLSTPFGQDSIPPVLSREALPHARTDRICPDSRGEAAPRINREDCFASHLATPDNDDNRNTLRHPRTQ
jgi:hypothetical protein